MFRCSVQSALQSHYVWASRSVRCPPIVLVQEFPFWGFGHARQEPDNCIGGLGCRRGSGRCRAGVRVALSAQFRCANGCRARNPRARSGRGRAPVSRVDSGAGDWHQVDGQALQVLQAIKALEVLQVLQTPPLGQLNSVCRMAPCVSPGPSCILGLAGTAAPSDRCNLRRAASARSPSTCRSTADRTRYGLGGAVRLARAVHRNSSGSSPSARSWWTSSAETNTTSPGPASVRSSPSLTSAWPRRTMIACSWG